MTTRTFSLLLALALAGCAKKSAETSAPEAGGAAPGDIDQLERELASREAQLRSVGVAPAGDRLARESERAEPTGGADVAAEEPARDLQGTRAAGAAPTAEAQAAPTSAPSGPAPSNRCVTVCELSTSICQLQDRICDLAPRHPGEPRYQAACERATLDCQFATEACHACS